MTDFFSKLISEATGGRARVMTGEDAFKFLADMLGKDCTDENCPLHGSVKEPEPDGLISDEMLQGLDSRAALDLAVAAGASANNSMRRGQRDKSSESRLLADMWMHLHSALADREDPEAEMDSALRAYRQVTEANSQLNKARDDADQAYRQVSEANVQMAAEIADLKDKLKVSEDFRLAVIAELQELNEQRSDARD